jgi:hypothetical protein
VPTGGGRFDNRSVSRTLHQATGRRSNPWMACWVAQAANSLNNLMRAPGTSFAGAIAGVLLASLVTTAGVPTEMAFVLVMLLGAGRRSSRW